MDTFSKRSIIILGCTGSIGTTALHALEAYRDRFEIVGLSAHGNSQRLSEIAREWNCKNVCISNRPDIDTPFAEHTNVFRGKNGLIDLIKNVDADMVLNAIAGADGLAPSFATIESGKDLALSNKESVVMAGKLLFDHARAYHARIIPVDSEHSTLHALLGAFGYEAVESLVITASGGPFREFPLDRMHEITVPMALAHPTWRMGPKISIDSATLANKGLEVMEAAFLFGFPAETIEVVIHPQSVVHSLVRMRNGALYAQLSPPDMALPIMAALADEHCPLTDVVKPLDFRDLNLTFQKPDMHRFPLLEDAFHCVTQKMAYPIAFNAADEIAVEAFVAGKVTFDRIAHIVHDTLESDWHFGFNTLEEIIAIDREARTKAASLIGRI